MLMLPDNVFITGCAGSGKDFIAAQLIQAGYTRLSFADSLKEEICAEYGITLEELTQRKAEFRPIMQNWGTTKRADQPTYWIDQWKSRRSTIAGPVVCADMRFPNEADCGLQLGALLFRVEVPEELRIQRLVARDGSFNPEWANHPSEQYVANLPVHFTFPGTLDAEMVLPTLRTLYLELLAVASVYG